MSVYVYTAPFNQAASLDELLAPYLQPPDAPPATLPAQANAPTLAEFQALEERVRVMELRMQAVTTAMNMGDRG